MSLLALLLAGWACAAPTTAGTTFVDGRLTRNLSGSVDIYEPFLHVNQWVNPWGGGAQVSGFPLSGQVSGNGGSFHFFGSGVSADINEFGGRYRVSARISRNGGQPTTFLSFSLDAQGPVNDPAYPPSFHVWESDANLRLNPSAGGRDYSISGWIDRERFGPEGVALVGIIAAMALQKRPIGAPLHLPDPTLSF